MRYTFGPVNSRRFGISLGIDLSPESKSCNFDCLYCELKGAKPTDKISDPPLVEDIVDEVKNALSKFPDIDVITITSNGEPTLYKELEKLVDHLNEIKGDKKLLILSNSSTICEENTAKILSKIDIVKLSLDCATQKCFKKLDRPLKNIFIEDMIACIKKFSKSFQNSLIIEVLLVKGINDNKQEIEKINEILLDIKPDRVDIGTIDRPPAYKVEALSQEELEKILNLFDKKLHISLIRKNRSSKRVELSEKEIMLLVSHRPQSLFDIETFFSQNSKNRLLKLIDKKKIKKINVAGVNFFTPA